VQFIQPLENLPISLIAHFIGFLWIIISYQAPIFMEDVVKLPLSYPRVFTSFALLCDGISVVFPFSPGVFSQGFWHGQSL